MAYVYAGYAVIVGLLGLYAVTLVVRRRRLVATAARLAAAGSAGIAAPGDPEGGR
jgi:hypothetical protein